MTEPSGKAKGGVARAKSLSPTARSEIAKKAAVARWGNQIPVATHGGADKIIRIGGIEISCYVLPDETRVLAQRGLHSAIGMSQGGGSGGASKIQLLLARLSAKGIEINDLIARANSPIKFIPPHGGNPADGYEATILPDLCSVLIKAHHQGVLDKRLIYMAERAEVLQHGFAKLGIIGLVDEATGYQDVRDRQALQKILDTYLLQEFAAWAKRFPDEFYKEMFRLRGWQYPSVSGGKPGVVGKYTMDIVYERLAPGLVEELEVKNPKTESGRRKSTHHQWLTEDVGHPALSSHIQSAIWLMKASDTWEGFMRALNRAKPKSGAQLSLRIDD
jgi:hypothetical protein